MNRYPNLQQAVDPATLSKQDKKMFDLLYSHELDSMLSALPDVERKLARETDSTGRQLLLRLRGICEQWTIYARYSSKMAKIEEARRFVQTVREVKRWLKEF